MFANNREEVRRSAEEFARNVEQQSGRTLTFDLPSLAVLDAFLSEWLDMASVYDAVDDRLVESLTFPLACYVGECLISTGHASWRVDRVADLALPALVLSGGRVLDLEAPVAAVLRRQMAPCFHQLVRELGGAEPAGNTPT